MPRLLIAIVVCLFSTAASAEKTDLKMIGSQGTNYFFTISAPWILDSRYVENVGRGFCDGKRLCAAHFWKTGTPAATRLPMTDEQMAAEMAVFQNGRMLWRCGAYDVATDSNCFSD
ncbi:hypothetical protein [Castellaniella sp.]|uniref:hypothetical protein n=1 Tax=Castellaniella sp. TaxID=1955812 RepID=UPI0035602EBA